MGTTPGVYFEQVDRRRPALGPLRTDVAALLGYAERGPLLAPVKVTSWRRFVEVFGTPLGYAYLSPAVAGYFDNGGAACYVVRVADPDGAAAAALTLQGEDGADTLRLFAAHGQIHDPITGEPQVEQGQPRRYDSPGAWGNRLSISVLPAGLGTTQTDGGQPQDGLTSYVAGLSGFQAGTIVRLIQDGAGSAEYRRIDEINAHRRQIVWNQPLTSLGLDLIRPIRLESVEFTIHVHLDGQIAEHHRNLSLSDSHERYAVTVLQADSRLIDAQVKWGAGDWPKPGRWPAEVDQQSLVGGDDGLATVDRDDFVAALAAVAKIDEVSLMAAPDLLLRAQPPPSSERASTAPARCQVLEPPPNGQLKGIVRQKRDDGTPIPLAGVQVSVLNSSAPAQQTDGNGAFTLDQLPLGHITLLLQHTGYYDLEVTTQAHIVPPTEPAIFQLAPITLPPALSLDDIFDVQQAMIDQGEKGLYRMAILDPPREMLGFEEIQTWRARFDSAYGALYYPWLQVPAENGGVRLLPPSGHVSGLIARTDLAQGVHRAPANYILENVEALSEDVDDARQGILNPLGINCIRHLLGRGLRVYGARTLSSDAEWRYLNVRRLVSMIEEAVEGSSQWAVFEPNNQILRQALTFSLHGFLNTLWRQGMLAGTTPEAAFLVKCDEENNPQQVVDAGQVIAEIAVAPTIPYEFIRFRLGRTVEAIKITE